MREYKVLVKNLENRKAVASVHGFSYNLSALTGSVEFGMNAAETLLSALGACLFTNINSLIKKMRLNIKDIELEILGMRSDKPPKIVEITVIFHIDTTESLKKIERMIELAFKYGTVTNTLLGSVNIKKEIKMEE